MLMLVGILAPIRGCLIRVCLSHLPNHCLIKLGRELKSTLQVCNHFGPEVLGWRGLVLWRLTVLAFTLGASRYPVASSLAGRT